MKTKFKIIRKPILLTALFTVIAFWQVSAQVGVRGTPMEHVDLSRASIEEIHQVAEKDAQLVWSLMRPPDTTEHKVSTITQKDVQQRASIFRVYARLHRLAGDNADAYVAWALDTLDRLRLTEYH